MTAHRQSEPARLDAFDSKQLMRQARRPRKIPGQCDRVGAGSRVLKVLVVTAEQHAANRFLRRVRNFGHAAHAALDGLAALRVAASLRPDVVLLDVQTPLMDGYQVAKHLRSDDLSQDCLIIAFAERARDACRRPCVEAGIDVLLSMPVDEEVVETLLMLECVRMNRRRAAEADKSQFLLTRIGANHVDRNA